MIAFLFLLIDLIVVIIWYKLYYQPKNLMARYVKKFKELGYKVYEHPFSFLGIGDSANIENCIKVHKDALYTQKTAYAKADVAVGNTLHKVIITFIKPDLMREFLSSETIFKYKKLDLLVKGIKGVFGDGILFSEGDIWKNKRKIISKAFNFELLKENIPKISGICEKWLDQLDQENKTEDGKIKYDPMHLSVRIFNGVMMKCFFGCDEVKEKVKGQCFEQFTIKVIQSSACLWQDLVLLLLGQFAYKHGLSSMIRKVKENTTIFKGIAAQIIQKRTEQIMKEEKSSKITNLLQALIYQKLENKEKEDKEDFIYTNKELIDEFTTFLFAGTDTTSRLFTMMIYYLAKYPDIQKKLRSQISEFIEAKEDITFENLKKLTYIDWIQHETTRHYGPANGQFIRIALEDHFVKDIPVSKGTTVAIQPLGSHYNSDCFKDPFVFRPERWQSECDSLPPFAFSGFSGGPRSCIGKQLAHLESKIALVNVILRYRWFSLQDGEEDLTMKLSLMYEPSPFEVIFEK